ncbi:MAG: aldehyde:ferredoxin oxidoreductase, partial [Gammaproteobacteria bacterium]
PYEDDFETTEPDNKAQVVKDSQDYIAAVDSSGLCLFPGDAGMSEELFAGQINMACEGNWDLERLLETGERIWNLEKQFNLIAHLTIKDDSLPPRILNEPATSGSAKGLVCRLDEMLPDYYKLRGWDENGVPLTATLERLSLSK